MTIRKILFIVITFLLIFCFELNISELNNFFIAIFSSGFGALSAFYFNIHQTKQEILKKNISSLKKAEYILIKYSINNKIIKKYIEKHLQKHSDISKEWSKIGLIDNKFPVIQIEVQSLLFLTDYNYKFALYYLSTFGENIEKELKHVHHAHAYILTSQKNIFLLDKVKSTYYHFELPEKNLDKLLLDLNIQNFSNYRVNTCIFEDITYEQQQLIISATRHTYNLLDKILLAISENEEVMYTIGERNNKYALFTERIQNHTYQNQSELKEIIQEKLYNELTAHTLRLVKTNQDSLNDCNLAASAIREFLKNYS